MTEMEVLATVTGITLRRTPRFYMVNSLLTAREREPTVKPALPA